MPKLLRKKTVKKSIKSRRNMKGGFLWSSQPAATTNAAPAPAPPAPAPLPTSEEPISNITEPTSSPTQANQTVPPAAPASNASTVEKPKKTFWNYLGYAGRKRNAKTKKQRRSSKK